MQNKCLLGLIFLSCMNRCIAQSIQTINNCTCQTSDGNFYSLWPLRGTEKPHFIDVKGKNGWRYAYNPCTSMTFGQDDPDHGKICHDIGICKYPEIEKPRDYLQVGVQTGVRCALGAEGQIELVYKTNDPSIDTKHSTVQLICDQTIPFPDFEPKDEDNYIFTIKTKCACPNRCWPVPVPTGPTKVIPTTTGPTKVIPTTTSNSTEHSPEGSKLVNWKLYILLPVLVVVIVIMLCFLCMWWHIPAFRNALNRRCCHRLGGYEQIEEEYRNHFKKTETTNVIKNKDKAVEHDDFDVKDELVEPVQDVDVGDKSQTVGKNDILTLVL